MSASQDSTAITKQEPSAGSSDIHLYFDGASVGNCSPLSPRFPDSRASWAFWAKGNGGLTVYEASGMLPGRVGTNNMAELTAALEALIWARTRGSRHVTLRGDSKVVIDFLNGVSRVSDKPWLAHLQFQIAQQIACETVPARDGARRVLRLLPRSTDDRLVVRAEHIPESKNKHADALSKRALC
jgi:ribonuclease HI